MNLINTEIKETYSLLQDKKFSYAESRAMVLLNKEPGNPKVFELIGDIYSNQQNYKKSVWYYISSCEQDEKNIDALYKLGENIYYLEYYALAEAYLKMVIEKEPLYTQAYITLGLSQQERGSLEEAIMCFEDAININPQEVFAYLNLALLHKKNKNFDKAIKVYQDAIINNPNNHFILSNLGNLFYLQKKYEDAVLCHEKAIKISPQSVIAHYNFGNTLYHAGEFEEAKKIYQKTIALDPSFNRAHSNLGSLDLLNQNFQEGFSEYRLRIFNDPLLKKIISKKKTIWRGEPINGKRILVCAETGYGNNIQFARYIPILKQLNCEIIFSCPSEIQHLFENVSEIDEIISSDQDYENFFCWVPLMDLPGILTPEFLQGCPVPVNIKINDSKLEEWEVLLGIDSKVKIGLCWQGSTSNPRDHLNSIDLSLFKDIISIPKTSFISLQKGLARKQIESCGFSSHVVDYDPLMDQGSYKFLDTVSIIKYLDLVITTDTAIAHLAGSLGVQTWVLLPKVPDWRWFLDTEESIWYENMRLFRQDSKGEWDGVIKKIKQETEIIVKNIEEIKNI
ncbi:tetratricopeptide repeat protein [Pelagibacteraceae bacterium]|jgi:tetratricopeptide (TPR) repeat protein|nr:tetratricopeptide repeat protein [Pelagibacteraceae bacterium]